MEAVDSEAIADSDFLIDLLRGKRGALALARDMAREGLHVYSTAVNAFELWLGAVRLGRAAQTRKLLDNLDILPLSKEAALAAADIISELSSKGRSLDYRDAFIAGIAKARKVSTIVSRDRAFTEVEGLKLRTF